MEKVPNSLGDMRPYVTKRFLLTRDLLLESNPENILDVGCNNGLLLSLLSQGIKKYGIDLLEQPQLLESTIDYMKHDVSTGLPYADDTFDVVNSSEVIEHLVETENFLQECYRVLKPGGRIVISTPNLHYWRNIIEWLKGNQFFLSIITSIKRDISIIFVLGRSKSLPGMLAFRISIHSLLVIGVGIALSLKQLLYCLRSFHGKRT